MNTKPTYEALEQKVKELEKEVAQCKQVQEELRESEKRYRCITEAVTDYIFTVRIEHGHPVETTHRPTCVMVTGYTPEDFASDPYLWIHMVHEEDRAIVQEQARRILLQHDVPPIEHRIFRKDGVIRWVRNTLVPHYNSQGELISYDGLVRDITERKQAEEALQESEERYRTIFESTGTATIIGDEDTTILMVNSQFEHLSGYSKQEIEGKKSWTEFVVKDDLEKLKGYHRMRRINPQAAPRNHEFRFMDRHHNMRHLFATVSMIPGTKMGVSSFSDITEHKSLEANLKQSEKRFRELADLLPDTVFEMDTQQNLKFVNRIAFDTFGYTQDDFDKGLNGLQLLIPEDRDRAKENMRRVVEGEKLDSDAYTAQRKNGTTFPVIMHVNPIICENELGGFSGIVIDITEHKRVEKALEYAAKRDPLTGLLNRRALLDMAKHELSRSKRSHLPFSIIIGDVDNFKLVNDNYGHAAGDSVLKGIASMFAKAMRAQDLVCRWGGEEFLILLPETDLKGGANVAEKLRRQVARKKFSFGGRKLALTISFGVAVHQLDLSLELTIKRADDCLYAAKHAGKNKVISTDSM